MIRKSHLLALALATAAIVAPIAQAGSTPKVDPLAVSYLMGRGLSPSEVKLWTVGVCSQQVKPAFCYAILDQAATITAASTQVVHSTGFQWVDAGIGAAVTLGIVLVLGGIVAGLMSRHPRRQLAART